MTAVHICARIMYIMTAVVPRSREMEACDHASSVCVCVSAVMTSIVGGGDKGVGIFGYCSDC